MFNLFKNNSPEERHKLATMQMAAINKVIDERRLTQLTDKVFWKLCEIQLKIDVAYSEMQKDLPIDMTNIVKLISDKVKS